MGHWTGRELSIQAYRLFDESTIYILADPTGITRTVP